MRRYSPGILLLILGVGFFCDYLGIWNVNSYLWRWWPLSIILLGLVHLMGSWSPKPAAVMLTLIGIALLVRELALVPNLVNPTFWPVMMMLTGLWVIGDRK